MVVSMPRRTLPRPVPSWPGCPARGVPGRADPARRRRHPEVLDPAPGAGRCCSSRQKASRRPRRPGTRAGTATGRRRGGLEQAGPPGRRSPPWYQGRCQLAGLHGLDQGRPSPAVQGVSSRTPAVASRRRDDGRVVECQQLAGTRPGGTPPPPAGGPRRGRGRSSRRRGPRARRPPGPGSSAAAPPRPRARAARARRGRGRTPRCRRGEHGHAAHRLHHRAPGHPPVDLGHPQVAEPGRAPGRP